MKKLLPIIFVGILVISGLGAVAVQDNDDKTFLNKELMTISKPVIADANEYITINLEESESLLL